MAGSLAAGGAEITHWRIGRLCCNAVVDATPLEIAFSRVSAEHEGNGDH
jgi:hypothetical protein